MKFGLIVIVAILGGAVFAHFMTGDPGYVVVNVGGYVVEMTVTALIVAVVVVLLAIWLLVRLIRLPGQVGEAAGELRRRRQTRQFTRGLIAAAEGRFAKGERLLTRGADNAETPMLNYLAAARVAHQQGSTERRDNWLMLAYEQTPGAGNAVLLTQAELQLANNQYEQALATLARIREDVPNHPQAITLLAKTYAAMDDWAPLADLLPQLQKQKRVDETTLADWGRRAAMARLAAAENSESALGEVWNALAKPLRSEPTLIARYARRLTKAGAARSAETLLRKALNRDWHASLVERYGELGDVDPAAQLKVVEGWLKNRGDDASLLYAAGRICIRDELWGKARSYLESAIGIAPSPAMYQAYGELLTALGEAEPAATAFRRGLGLAAGSATLSLPAPDGAQKDADEPAGATDAPDATR